MKKVFALLIVATMLATVALCAVSVSAETTNLALNKNYTGAEPSSVANYSAKLTDGNAADKPSYDDNWFAFYYNADATPDKINAPEGVGTVVIDLEALCTVESIRVNTYQGDIGDGILPPKSMKVEISADGETYTQFGEEKTFTAEKDSTLVDWVEFKADAADARYVKLTVVLNSIWAFLNEIEVYGSVKGDDAGNTETGSEESKDESKEESKDEGKEETTSTPVASESTPTETSKPTTGDAGMLVFAVLAVLAVAGSVVAVRARH